MTLPLTIVSPTNKRTNLESFDEAGLLSLRSLRLFQLSVAIPLDVDRPEERLVRDLLLVALGLAQPRVQLLDVPLQHGHALPLQRGGTDETALRRRDHGLDLGGVSFAGFLGDGRGR